MFKSFYNQCIVIFFDKKIQLESIKPFIKTGIKFERPANEIVYFSGPAYVLDYQSKSEPILNGQVYLDIINEVWPDDMGQENQEILGAWVMKHFGPFTYPGCLYRGMKQAWAWEGAEEIISNHQSYLRIRLNYFTGKENPKFNIGFDDEDKELHLDYEEFDKQLDEESRQSLNELSENHPMIPLEVINPKDELDFLTQIALNLLDHPNALGYFNPNGELLLNKESLNQRFQHFYSQSLPAVPAWSNIRLIQLKDNIHLMDSIGNLQLDIPDIECLFDIDKIDPNDVDSFIQNLSLYIFSDPDAMKDGDTVDGPGGVWQLFHRIADSEGNCQNIIDPPRDCYRFFPQDDTEFPDEFYKNNSN